VPGEDKVENERAREKEREERAAGKKGESEESSRTRFGASPIILQSSATTHRHFLPPRQWGTVRIALMAKRAEKSPGSTQVLISFPASRVFPACPPPIDAGVRRKRRMRNVELCVRAQTCVASFLSLSLSLFVRTRKYVVARTLNDNIATVTRT